MDHRYSLRFEEALLALKKRACMENRESFVLRPLSIGEIFDRAVTIYVRNFVVFTLMVLTLLAPVTIIEYVAIPDQSASMTQAIGQIQHPAKQKAPPLSNREIAGYAIVIVLALLLAPFVNNAVAVGVAQVYNDAEPSYALSFITVFRRWLPLLGTAILNVLVLIGAYGVGLFAIVMILTLAFLALAYKAVGVGIIAAVIGVVILVAFLLAFILMIVAYAFAMYATSLENAGPGHALALAYRRLFNRKELKKATLMALAYIGLQFGILLLSAGIGMIAVFVVKSYALQLALNAVVSAMLSAFLTILLAVYYYDVRTRAEGLDLETDLQRLAIAPA